MIPFASQRGGGQDLATHLLNAYDNEIAEVAHLRGAVADDLHGAFKEWEVQADSLTRCRKYLYSLSINPDPMQGPLTRDQYMDYIGRTEDALGLKEQPRAIVFHTKYGREHCHVVWSRIDADQQKAVHLAFDRDKLMRVTRGFAQDHCLDLPAGYGQSRQVGQDTLYEKAQERQTGISKDDHKRQVTEAWRHSDDANAFVQALAERGYILATGDKRPYVLVDLYGNVNALPKLIDDKTVRTKDIRAFLEKDYPAEALPSVAEAEKLVDEHRKLIERSLSAEQYASRLADLQHGQSERRSAVEMDRIRLRQQHHQARLEQQERHRSQRQTLRNAHFQAMREVRDARNQNRPTGLAAFLGKVSGVALIRKVLHRHEDAKRMNGYLEQRTQLKARQAEERRALDLRLKLQGEEGDRKIAALKKVDQRELKAFMRDQRTDQRVRDRGGTETMPSLIKLVKTERRAEVRPPDLLSTFEQASTSSQNRIPDVLDAFERASRRYEASDRAGEVGQAPPEIKPEDQNGRGR